MSVYVISFVWGFLIGGACTLLFFQSDKAWLKIISVVLGISGSGYSYNVIGSLVGETNITILRNAFGLMLCAVIIAIIIVTWLMWLILKDNDKDSIFRIRDIIFGKQEYVSKVYQKRVDELNAKSESKVLEKEKKELDVLRDDLTSREKELYIKEKKLNEQIRQSVSLYLPIDSPVPVTNDFLFQFPDFIEGLAKFINHVNRFTEEYLVEVPDNYEEKYNAIYSYFIGLCSFMMEDVFDSSAKNVRIHFRVLKNGQHVKFVAKVGKVIYEDDLTPIPYGRGMIKEAYINQTSLIKSLNTGHNYKSKHKNIWEDYMTISFYEICKDDIPFLSMGISVKNKEKFKNLLYFLNFYKIENFIQENLCKIHKAYNIIDTIENHFNKEDVEV